jgi:hypothetical protein
MSDSVPAIAYGFVGLTALVLTYATLADAGNKEGETPESATSMLPTVGETQPEPSAPPTSPTSPTDDAIPAAEPVPENKPDGTFGGKRKKSKGGKKSKMKHSEKKKRHTRRQKA